ncbi:MAG: bifunctional oligoribonuclease/PAP phosphatase NrnA [Solirubrobacterales bacterium]|nr:bifunctional oligoribonuclease/PAP phosphatase NrnA [Solirubrobacterales bacterium]MBV9916060.1 bifunctional oligoribonuclease/PAP phosphatase NrnA [Solirubrobacterales bacterium]
MAENGSRSSREQILAELRAAPKLIVVTHENPDGDALGSLAAMQEILRRLGKDSLMFMDADEFPLPPEYGFLALEDVITSPPTDLDERTIVFLDCGNLERNPAEAFQRPGAHILNIDHHHDNTRFGTVNLVDPEASCTAEILWDLMHGLGVDPTPTIAEALYVGLITDTGRFMYENTGPRAHQMAAELIEAGVDVNEVYRRVYEGVPFGKLALLARSLAKAKRYDDGRLTLSALSAQDFSDSGAEESYSEGVVDHLRAVEGTAVAALVRERIGSTDGAPRRKVSLRASDDRVDVSRIARAQGGGGHRGAAGFTTNMESEDIVAFLRQEVAQQLV